SRRCRTDIARVRMLHHLIQAKSLLIFLASALVFVGTSSSGSPASLSSATVPAAARDLTLSFDADPAYSEFYSIQPGHRCVNGINVGTKKSRSAAFVRDASAGNVRHGKYSARVVLNP